MLAALHKLLYVAQHDDSTPCCALPDSVAPVAGCPMPTSPAVTLPPRLELVMDVALPGGATRFDYQDVDPAHQQLVVVHQKRQCRRYPGPQRRLSARPLDRYCDTTRGCHRTGYRSHFRDQQAGRAGDHRQSVAARSAARKDRHRPDGNAWDPVEKLSRYQTSAMAPVADPQGGEGMRRQIALGVETGNVVYDGLRHRF